MGSLWPTFDDIKRVRTPKEILEEQGKFLPKLTGDLVYAVVEEFATFNNPSPSSDSLENQFMYKFLMKSKFIDRYSFELFAFSHDIAIYPVKMRLDQLVAKELGYSKIYNISNENHLNEVLGEILRTDRVKFVVGSMMSLAK